MVQHGTVPAIERRLAAIMAADVAHYSSLMEADEIGTLRALKTHRHERTDRIISRLAFAQVWRTSLRSILTFQVLQGSRLTVTVNLIRKPRFLGHHLLGHLPNHVATIKARPRRTARRVGPLVR